ncbi:hypothetical protein F528_0281 [Neisseria meningitidis 992008]|nr:hypothetical protein F528_0281 [Neisseria meningitidis 992008]
MKISMNKNLGAVLDKMMCRCRLKPVSGFRRHLSVKTDRNKGNADVCRCRRRILRL